MGKTAYLISCSDHYSHRMYMADGCLREMGYNTTYITSDFDHTAKQNFQCKVPGCVQIPVKPYRKNLSADRILSHMFFARDVFAYLEKLPEEPNVVVVLLPPNFLGHYAAKYKKKHPNVKLIFDIFDLWPETFPLGKAKKLLAPAFAVWAWIRDHSLSAADFVTTECELFQQKLKLPEKTSETVWLCAEPLKNEKPQPELRTDILELCYLGSINNVISIPDICGLIRELTAKMPVVLHIIGKGESEQEFVDGAKAAGADVIFHGPVYDDAQKLEIMSKCHFGLNIMKTSVCVGLTMKSVDYFRFGLPIINNIPSDTEKLVREQGIGVQLEPGCAERILALSSDAYLAMRENVERMFGEYFEHSVIVKRYGDILDRICGESKHK